MRGSFAPFIDHELVALSEETVDRVHRDQVGEGANQKFLIDPEIERGFADVITEPTEIECIALLQKPPRSGKRLTNSISFGVSGGWSRSKKFWPESGLI